MNHFCNWRTHSKSPRTFKIMHLNEALNIALSFWRYISAYFLLLIYLSHIIMDLLRMTWALTLNGEANFEWQTAVKATTQLITHVTSKYSREPVREKIRHRQKRSWHRSADHEKKRRSSSITRMTFYTFLIVTCNFEFQSNYLFWGFSRVFELVVIFKKNWLTYFKANYTIFVS